MANSTTNRAGSNPSKPQKPHPDFPLFPHATGRWAKKVRGRFCFFGKVADDPKGEKALETWLEQKDDLLAGRTPRGKAEGLTLRELLDRFVVGKRHLLDTREISAKHFAELYGTCRRIGDAFGFDRLVIDLANDDFDRLRQSIAKQWGPARLGNEIQRVRSVFKFGYDSGLIDRPVRFGPSFKKPTRKVMRQHRAKNGLRMFEASELRTIIAAATQPMKSMVLLGINCGFGNGDVANLPMQGARSEIWLGQVPAPEDWNRPAYPALAGNRRRNQGSDAGSAEGKRPKRCSIGLYHGARPSVGKGRDQRSRPRNWENQDPQQLIL